MGKIVSLIPSGTEIICALGLQDRLIGRSHECDFPPSISHLPVCTAPTIHVNGTSQDIHERVSHRLQDALSMYRVNTDVLKTLQPECIVTQTQCDVCAVSFTEVEQAVKDVLDVQPTVISLHATSLEGLWQDIQRVAEGLNLPKKGNAVLEGYHARIAAIQHRVRTTSSRPTVACIEWMDPLMAAGNWVPELVHLAGGISVFGKPGEHAPWINWEEFDKADPEIILLMPCGFSMKRIEEEISLLTNHPYWHSLRAVQNGRVYLTDGNQYFNRPGPRLVESLEILAEIFHPTHFHFGHQKQGWRTWSG